MKIVDRRKSIETCTEAGWDAIDLLCEEALTDEDIRKIGKVGGSFVYMSMLKKPFFKIENHNYVIKGIKGDSHFRMAVHKDYLSEVDRVVESLMHD